MLEATESFPWTLASFPRNTTDIYASCKEQPIPYSCVLSFQTMPTMCQLP